jgi:hypothetical protein
MHNWIERQQNYIICYGNIFSFVSLLYVSCSFIIFVFFSLFVCFPYYYHYIRYVVLILTMVAVHQWCLSGFQSTTFFILSCCYHHMFIICPIGQNGSTQPHSITCKKITKSFLTIVIDDHYHCHVDHCHVDHCLTEC